MLKSSFNGNLLRQAVTTYKRAAKSLNELIEEKNIGQINKSTTFVHELFKAVASKEDIEYYFSKVLHAIGYDTELTKNYMS